MITPSGQVLTDLHMRILYVLGEHDLRAPGTFMTLADVHQIVSSNVTTEELKRRYWALRDARTQ